MCMSLWSWCVVVWHAENLRVYIQNFPVCTGTTPACGNTLAGVVPVHTEGVLSTREKGGGR